MTLRFRVSGQGKRLFGDGFALWVTQDAYHKDGPLHGYSDTFTGFGVIFDTFVNTEPGHVHKDVSLVTNDGQQSRAAPHGGVNDPQAPGCDADFRFHEGRDDFNAAKARSAARIHYDSRSRSVTVEIDARNTGEWIKCIDKAVVDLPAEWHKSAHVGMTATTGQLADNHDIISLQVLEGNGVVADAAKEASENAPAMISTGQPRFDVAAQTAATREAGIVKAEMLELHHELEHHMDKIYDELKHTVKRLQEAEAKVEERVREIELKLSSSVQDQVERHMNHNVQKKVEETVKDRLSDTVKRSLDGAVASAKQGVETSLNSARDLGSRVQAQLEEMRTLSRSAGSDVTNPAAWSGGTWAAAIFVGVIIVGALVFLFVLALGGGSGSGARGRGRRGGGGGGIGGILPGLGSAKKDHFV